MGGPGSGRKPNKNKFSLPTENKQSFTFRISDGKGGYKNEKLKAKDIHEARVKAQAKWGQ